jgi:pimeloyl-ACP methyl ester carboxylesterase
MIRMLRTLLLVLLSSALAGCAHISERFVDVDAGGHRLHLLVVGNMGGGRQKPTVILESGAGGTIGWQNTRSRIARFAQVITYDRAGFGQSEPGPEPRNARAIVRDLHAALHRAAVAPPYVLVGQSSGGLYVQVFAAMYPQETAGLVFVDPTHASTELCLSTGQVKTWFMTHQWADWPRVEAATRGAPDGLQSFLDCKYKLMETFIESVPEPRRSAMRSEWWAMIDQIIGPNPNWELTGAARQEATVMADSIRQAIAARPLPKVPTILLAAGKTDLYKMPTDGLTPNVRALQEESRRWRRAAYQQWIDDTPNAKLIIVEGSGHDIESERPQAVIDAVREVLR